MELVHFHNQYTDGFVDKLLALNLTNEHADKNADGRAMPMNAAKKEKFWSEPEITGLKLEDGKWPTIQGLTMGLKALLSENGLEHSSKN